jgi:hypothetical protein
MAWKCSQPPLMVHSGVVARANGGGYLCQGVVWSSLQLVFIIFFVFLKLTWQNSDHLF